MPITNAARAFRSEDGLLRKAGRGARDQHMVPHANELPKAANAVADILFQVTTGRAHDSHRHTGE